MRSSDLSDRVDQVEDAVDPGQLVRGSIRDGQPQFACAEASFSTSSAHEAAPHCCAPQVHLHIYHFLHLKAWVSILRRQ